MPPLPRARIVPRPATPPQEEIDDFLSFAADSESGLMHYEDYVMQVTIS